MSRILVIGGSSLLGQYVIQEGFSRGHDVWATQHETACTTPGVRLVDMDLQDGGSLKRGFDAARPDQVVLCAALTGVDYCEEHPEEAGRVNAQGPSDVATLCKETGSRLVHISTDYVFDGRNGPYDEEGEPHPLNVYGRSKREGEREVLRRHPGSVVVRISVVYGWNRLVEKANGVTWIVGRLRRGESTPLFTDQRVSPTYAADASPIILDLAAMEASGLFHVAPPDCVSRLELGEVVCDVFGLPQSLLQPTTMAGADLKAERPLHSCLKSKRLPATVNRTSRPLRVALAHMRDDE